ncbi:hypothetical protein QAD02_021166 [Eretmocerus hayati]|uniref:Uncharacterized protein n=1 Tax=Eretmocerus hayati TaxID=131215 RepID=A0ACC2PPH9_9HYME|nr:hypothetical protein QAD02_021166 [Eretmocerus hayati]
MGTIDDARKAFLTDQRSDKPTKDIGDIDQDTINVEQTGLVRNTSREIVSNESVMHREDVGLDVVCAESDVASSFFSLLQAMSVLWRLRNKELKHVMQYHQLSPMTII